MLYLSLFPIGEDDPYQRLYMFRLLMGKEKSSFHIADERACQYWRQILKRKLNWERTQQYFFVVVLTTHKSLSVSQQQFVSQWCSEFTDRLNKEKHFQFSIEWYIWDVCDGCNFRFQVYLSFYLLLFHPCMRNWA